MLAGVRSVERAGPRRVVPGEPVEGLMYVTPSRLARSRRRDSEVLALYQPRRTRRTIRASNTCPTGSCGPVRYAYDN